jgi:PAS domain S-box-containing protein
MGERQIGAKSFETLMASAPDAMILVDASGAIEWVNLQAERLFGYPREELVGGILDQLIPERYRIGHREWVEGCFQSGSHQATGAAQELHVLRKGGIEIPVEINLSLIALEEGARAICAIRDVSERMRLEVELKAANRELEARNRLIQARDKLIEVGFDNVPAMFGYWDTSLRCQLANQKYLDWFGRTKASMIGASIQELMGEELFKKNEPHIRMALQGERQSFERTLIKPNGEVGHLWAQYVPHVVDGEVQGFFSLISDINDLKNGQESLRRSEEKWRTLFHLIPIGIALLDEQRSVLESNPALGRILDLNQAELRKGAHAARRYLRGDGSGLPKEELPSLRSMREQRSIEGEEVGIVMEDGTVRWMEISAAPLNIPGYGCVVVTTDITSSKQGSLALEESEARLSRMMAAAPVAFALNDAEGRITYLNEAFTRTFGYTREDIPTLAEWWPKAYPDPEYRAWVMRAWQSRLEQVQREGFPFQPLELEVRCKSGETRMVSVGTSSLARDLTHEWLVTLVDISELKRLEAERRALEQELTQRQKMESLGALAGGVAHDMNNVLTAILGLASVQLERQPADAPLHPVFESIAKACERGAGLVKGLLSFARKGLAENRELDVNALVKDQILLLKHTTLAKIQLVEDLAAHPPLMSGDASAICHALMNLCVNAVDALPQNGRLTIRTRQTGDWVELEVEDNGTGMPQDVLDRALDPFFTTKPQGRGTGLGLAIVYRTVQAHGGQLSIHSAPGEGTRVRMRFPALKKGVQVAESPSQGALPAPGKPLSVLLVDDDPLVLESVGMLLEVLGHAPSTATRGEEALALIAGGLRPDVVILDQNMPGLGGAATLGRLRALLPDVPVLFATGRVEQTTLELVDSHPGVTLLTKPFTLKDLEGRLLNVKTP